MLNRDALARGAPIDSRKIYEVLEAESGLTLGEIAMIDGLLVAKAALGLSGVRCANYIAGGGLERERKSGRIRTV